MWGAGSGWYITLVRYRLLQLALLPALHKQVASKCNYRLSKRLGLLYLKISLDLAIMDLIKRFPVIQLVWLTQLFWTRGKTL